LVAATAPREIVAAVLQAVADFGATSVDARVCRLGGDHVAVMSLDAAGELTEWEASGEISELLHECGDGGLSALPASARDQLRLPADREQVLLLELRPAGPSNAGLMLVLAGDAADDQETRYALRTLAHQVALALGSAELAAEVHRRTSEARFATLVQN